MRQEQNGDGFACYIKNNNAHKPKLSISESIENTVLDILLFKSKPITVGIICRPPIEVDFVDHFNNALGKQPFQYDGVYLLGDFNINLFFEGHYVLKKYFKRIKEAQLKHRLSKTYIKINKKQRD